MTNAIKSYVLAMIVTVLVGSASVFAETSFTAGYDPDAAAASIMPDAGPIAGVWRARVNYGVCVSIDEFIFQANGSYSSMTKCSNGYMYYESGRWEVVGNAVIHCYIDNWEPKVFAGNVIRANPGKTFSYRFLDYNTMQTPDLTLTRVR